ncbi:MAG: Spy/CpxP family protein refolding chaperone [Verrucomicrobiota bacterium]|nr:Spy/CpxP family protein refolding chaperone [Verrucomicrobiota bacterium]
MNKTKILSLAGAVALTGFVGIGWAAGANDSNRPHFFRQLFLGKLAELGVNESQKQQIHAILREARPGFQPLVVQYVQERRTLRKAIHTVPVNEAAIRAQATRVAQLEADLAVKRAYVSEQIRAVLTPHQVEKLKELAGVIDARVDNMLERINERIAEQ